MSANITKVTLGSTLLEFFEETLLEDIDAFSLAKLIKDLPKDQLKRLGAILSNTGRLCFVKSLSLLECAVFIETNVFVRE